MLYNKKISKIWSLFSTFFKIAFFTVGGGYAMLPVMEEEFVEKKKWIHHTDIVDVMALVQSVPGVIAVNAAVFVGNRVAGTLGAIAAAIGVVLPSFIIIVLIAMFMDNVQDIPLVKEAFLGVRAGVCAMILLSAINFWQKIVKGRLEIIIVVCAFIAITFVQINVIYIISGAGMIGFIRYFINSKKLKLVNKKDNHNV